MNGCDTPNEFVNTETGAYCRNLELCDRSPAQCVFFAFLSFSTGAKEDAEDMKRREARSTMTAYDRIDV